MVAALAWTVYDGLPAGIWLWTETVWSVQYSLILFGPLVGGLSVWMADRERRRGTADLLSTTPRAAARDLAVWTATVYWCGLAYVTVAATFMPLTYPNATWGAPDPGPILTGLFVAIIPLVGDGSGERKWAWWAWVDQPAGDSLSWTLASVLCVLGLGLVCLRGAADTLREAE